MNTGIIAAILAISTSISATTAAVSPTFHSQQSNVRNMPISVTTDAANNDISQGKPFHLPTGSAPLNNPAVINEDYLPTAPTTVAEFHAVWDYAVKHDSDEVTFTYNVSCTEAVQDNLSKLIKESSNVYRYTYPEKFNYRKATSYAYRDKSETGFTLTIRFASVDSTVNSTFKDIADAKAIEVYAELRDSGTLTDAMTEQERAWAILNWLAANTTYLNTQNALCHTAYSVFEHKSGVCDAYTAAYQTLLHLDGIECYGVKGRIKASNEPHSWSKVSLDGQWLNVDACACDAGTHAVTAYFAITDETLSRTHEWN